MTIPPRIALVVITGALVPGLGTLEAQAVGVGSDEDGRILRVNPATGAPATVSQAGLLGDPLGIAVEPSGSLVVADASFAGGPGAVTRIDPATGAQALVTSGGNLVDPFGIAAEPSGALVVTDPLVGVIRVDPGTGVQSVVLPSGSFVPFAVAVEPGGDIVVAAFGQNDSVVLRIDPMTGLPTIVASLGAAAFPTGIAVEPSGDLVLTLIDLGGVSGEDIQGMVIRVDPDTGLRTILASGGGLNLPVGIAVEPTGGLVVTVGDFFGLRLGTPPGIVRVNPMNGSQTVLTSGSGLVLPFDIAVEPSGDLVVADAGALTVCEGLFATRTGTSGSDVIEGTGGPDVIIAGEGNDRVRASGDDDLVCGGSGNDRTRGGAGDDGLEGEGGRDLLNGQGGSDFLIGSTGNDRAAGGAGRDLAIGGKGRDRLRGQGGNDQLAGQRGADLLAGGPGRDTCNGGGGGDRVSQCENRPRRVLARATSASERESENRGGPWSLIRWPFDNAGSQVTPTAARPGTPR
jgi:DNA-binding beta-propeller fold protein YncE